MNEGVILSTRAIADAIYDTCYRVDRDISGWPEKNATQYAIANSVRHAHTIKAIMDYATQCEKKSLRILNASGLSCGHGDFSIVKFLKEQAGVNIQWTVFESPNNRFLENEIFRNYIKTLEIDLELSDFSQAKHLFGNEREAFDIVLFAEIAEHLDYSVFLKALATIRDRLKNDGMLILTTPNLLDVSKRIKFVLGHTNFYEGDGRENMEHGVFGHVILYDINRLRRILPDAGFNIVKSYSFNHWASSFKQRPVKFIISRIFDLLLAPFKNSQFTILIVANKSKSIKIPLVI